MEDQLFNETNKEFRNVYSRYVRMYYPNIDEYTSLVIGEMAANKIRFGVIYPQIYEDLIKSVNQSILNS